MRFNIELIHCRLKQQKIRVFFLYDRSGSGYGEESTRKNPEQ